MERSKATWKKKSGRPNTTQLKHNNNKHILFVFWDKKKNQFNSIQFKEIQIKEAIIKKNY